MSFWVEDPGCRPRTKEWRSLTERKTDRKPPTLSFWFLDRGRRPKAEVLLSFFGRQKRLPSRQPLLTIKNNNFLILVDPWNLRLPRKAARLHLPALLMTSQSLLYRLTATTIRGRVAPVRQSPNTTEFHSSRQVNESCLLRMQNS